MDQQFFPNTWFGIVFSMLLMPFLIVATYHDLRTTIIPKWISLVLAGLGLVINICRGAWLGAVGLPVFLWQEPGPVLGAIDGALFALFGFLLGLGFFVLMWILGLCGGGDAKLFAAVSAWMGPIFAFITLALTVVMVMLISLCRLVWYVASRLLQPAQPNQPRGRLSVREAMGKIRLTYYSLPIAMAVPVVLWLQFLSPLPLATDLESGAKAQSVVRPAEPVSQRELTEG